MKIVKRLLVLFILAVITSAAVYAGGKKEAKIDELDAAIRDTSNYLNSAIPAKSKIVILNIQSDSPALSEYVIDELIANAVNDRIFSVVDRHQLDAIRAEQNFQTSGEVADNQALEIGKFFGAQTIVSGAITPLGNGHRIRVRALNVETAVVQGQFNKNITDSKLIAMITGKSPSGSGSSSSSSYSSSASSGSSSSSSSSSSRSGSSGSSNTPVTITIVNNTGHDHIRVFFFDSKILGTSDNSGIQNLNIDGMLKNNESKTVTLPRLTANSRYSIGMTDRERNANVYRKDRIEITGGMTLTFSSEDQKTAHAPEFRVGQTGPAGGLIFYDKGNNQGGWRYLEAAPVEAESRASWRVSPDTNFEANLSSIGSGRRNTQQIVEVFNKTSGEWDNAAQKCDDLEFGGFDDWFLPSKDELDQIYGQLKRRNLGDFKNEEYWSSSLLGNRSICNQNFSNGTQSTDYHGYRVCYVRPIRQVPGPN